MSIFEYEGKTKQGALRKGKMDATDETAVVSALRSVGVYPIRINNEKKSFFNMDLSQFQKVSLKDLYIFCREFSYIMGSGMGIVKALDILKDETENKRFKTVISNVSDSVQKGQELSKSFGDYKEFPELFVNMISVGEASGNLDDIMKKLADYYEKEYKQQQKVKQALTYPAIISIFAFLVVNVLVIKVVPTFTNIILQDGGTASSIPLPTKIVTSISSSLVNFWWIYILVIAGLISAFKYITKLKKFEYDKLKIDMPVIGKIIRKLISAKFARTFGILINSGITILTSIEVSANVVENEYVKNLILGTMEELQKGAGLSETLDSLGIFPSMLTQMIRVGEESGTLDSVLTKTAEFYDGEIEVATAQLTTLIEPAIIIILGVIVGFVIVSILLPIFQTYSLAGN